MLKQKKKRVGARDYENMDVSKKRIFRSHIIVFLIVNKSMNNQDGNCTINIKPNFLPNFKSGRNSITR